MKLDQARQALQDRLSQLTRRVTKIDTDLRDPGSKDWQERATENENDEVLEQLGDTDRREIQDIRAALQRIDAGIYTVCAECGDEITAQRLEAVPYTRVCIACAR